MKPKSPPIPCLVPEAANDDFEKKLGRLLTEREVSEILGVHRRTLQEWRTQRWQDSHPPEECGPPYIHVGSGKRSSVRYPSAELTNWVERRRHPQLAS
jgi:predicted DNA-binding transcriptional regulator AlpA